MDMLPPSVGTLAGEVERRSSPLLPTGIAGDSERRRSPQTLERRLAGEISISSQRIGSRRWSSTGRPAGNINLLNVPPGASGDTTAGGASAGDGAFNVFKPGDEEPELKEEEDDVEDLLVQPQSDKVLRVLSKSFDSRTDEDLAIVQRATADVKFFSTLTAMQHTELCRVMTYEVLPKDSPVFAQGDDGTTFYIIYAGAAKVFISDGHLAAQQSCVCVLEDGDSFGELALLGDGVRRATVITAMPTQLLKVEKDAYERSLQKLHETDLRSRMRFLQRVFLFSDWADDDLKRLALVVSRKRYEKGATIIKQGESTDNMYLMTSGRCRVLKQMGLSRTQQQMLSVSSPRVSGAPPLPPPPLHDEGPAVLEICELSVHQYFGELALLDKGEHTASVCAITPVEVLLLSKYDFYHHVDTKTQAMMKTFAEKFYFDEGSIRKHISKQHRWDAYKKNLLKDVVSRKS